MDKEITIHIGAPKTATTFIQKSLELNRTILQRQGFDVLLPTQLRKLDFYQYIHNKHTQSKSNITLQAAQNSFKSILKNCPNNKIIISEEGFSYNLMPSNVTNGSFGGMKRSVQAISDVIGQNFSIILTIRNQINFIESSYKHKVKWKMCSLTFEEFLTRHINLYDISWGKVIKIIENYFPKNLSIIPFELVKISPQKYFDYFISACEVNCDQMHFKLPVKDGLHNKSLSDHQTQFMQNINKLYKTFDSFDNTKSQTIFEFVLDLLANESVENLQSFSIPNALANKVKFKYKNENMQILKKYCKQSDLASISNYY